MADLPVQLVIVLALGGAVVGGPEALRLLLDVTGRSLAADVMIAVFLIFAVTALVLGTMLLARYVSVAETNDAAPLQPGTARLAMVTLAVALAVVVFVAACLVAIPSGGLGGAARSCSAA
ncbi:hypothetical protein PR202_ga17843 [Eleusine coracana subsp. coracana]|uniref:Uncharacterized protein n=1 Tax=Eleusine coracana subsp. coracana TaxID=191504 RepID=A0AAV5CQ40_ELECO|nr:hypothetical protein QOZ80_6AG0512600 [Eleusine coracana subsp. coracana]GJN00647.1 hypothetical protein PR202_ga17843 [Eleusine coracana subsp. coracana]